MIQSTSYDALQIAYDFMERAQQLADQNNFDDAQAALDRAEAYAFNHTSLLDNIQHRRQTIDEARHQFVKSLEEEAANLFSEDQFDGQTARKLLQNLLYLDSDNELAKILWTDLPAKEAAERERRLVGEFKLELEGIWEQASELESRGAGTRAVEEYERALSAAAKKAGNTPDSIPLQRLKMEALERRNRAKDKWIGTPTLILDRKSQELVERYEALKARGEVETEFFDENGEFLGKLPVDECISRAKEMASGFAAQKAQDYLGQAQALLQESPGAAQDKIQEALSLAYLSDFTKSRLERELKDKIAPAVQLRKKAAHQLNVALSKNEPEEAWLLLGEVDQLDSFTPGLKDARQRLFPMMLQKFSHLIDAGQRLQGLEDFEAARVNFQKAVNVAQRFSTYGGEFRHLLPQAQEALNQCLQAEKEAQAFDRPLQEIARQIETQPHLAKEQLERLAIQELPPQILAKIKRLRVQIDFNLGVGQLFNSIEQKMLSAKDDVELIPIAETANQALQDYPGERRFQRLRDRIETRRFFLRARRLRDDPEKWLDAKELLQQVVSRDGDDATAAQALINEISADEEQEADIAIALRQADMALASGDARLTFLLLEPYRYAVSPQASRVRQLLSTAVTRWRDEIDQQLETTVASVDFTLPQVEHLIKELERSQAPRLEEWKIRALAPAYAKAARDLQDLNRWDRASELWEKAFRLAPGDPLIVEGRRNAQKQCALIQAQLIFDPAEKEQNLNDLNNTYANDLTVKRHLAEFYYAEEQYAEARMAVSQAMFLAEHQVAPDLDKDVRAIRQLDALLKEVEDVERRKLDIHSRLAGHTTVAELWEARMAFEELLQASPNHTAKLEDWWAALTAEIIDRMRAQIAELTEKAGTLWGRTELLCKILALRDDAQFEERAVRLLKLAYKQLPAEVASVLNNPNGTGYGPASEALANHAAKARNMYRMLINISQADRISADLGISSVECTVDPDRALYELGLIIERLYTAQEKQREIRGQIVTAMMTGEWDSIEYGLHELERMGLSEHQGLRGLVDEVRKARDRREELESVAAQIRDSASREAFEVIQENLEYLAKLDPADEARLRSNLEIVDPYTGLKVKGHRELGVLISEKLDTLDTLTGWRAEIQPVVDWPTARLKVEELADSGTFVEAIELCQAIAGTDDAHQSILEDETWSLGHLMQYLKSPPVSEDDVNSERVQATLSQVYREIQTLEAQVDQCNLYVSELEQKEAEFSQIVQELRSLVERLNKTRGFFGALFRSSVEVRAARARALELLEEGRRISPNYAGFVMIERVWGERP